MAEVNLVINSRNYSVSCDDGQEQRLMDLAHYVDQRMKDISRSGAAHNENHLLVLTSLILADELYEVRDNLGDLNQHLQAGQGFKEEEAAIAHAIDLLADRIDHIAGRIQKA